MHKLRNDYLPDHPLDAEEYLAVKELKKQMFDLALAFSACVSVLLLILVWWF